MSQVAGVAWADRRDGLAVVAVAAAIRAAYLASLLADAPLAAIRSVDSRAYLAAAERILAGQWPEAGFHSGSLYPWLIAAVGGGTTAVLLLQGLADSASAYLAWRLARPLGRVAALASGLLLATAGIAVFGAGTVLFDGLGVLLVLAATAVGASAAERGSLPRWLACGALLALAGTARPFVLGFPVVLASAAAARGLEARAALRSVGAAAAGVALVLVPWALVQREATGEARLLPPSGGITFFIGNNPRADGTLAVPVDLGVGTTGEAYVRGARTVPARRLGRPVSDAEASAFWFREGLAWWRAEPAAAAALTARKAAMLLNAAELPDNYDHALARERIALLRWLPGWLPVLALAPWGIVVALRTRRLGAVIAMTAIHAAVLPLFLATGRLRLPLMALLCVAAGAALGDLVERARSRRRLLPPLLAVVASAALALWPLEPRAGLPAPASLRQLAAAFVELGRPVEGIAVLDRIPSADAGSTHAIRADALRALGRAEEAARAYRSAIALDPGDDASHRALEAILAARPPGAEERALTLAARERGDAAAWLALAHRRLGEDRHDAAIAAARAAVAAGAGDEAELLLARALRARGRAGESAERLAALAERRPGDALVLSELGFSLVADGRPDEGWTRFEAAIAADPRCAPAFFGLARIAVRSGRRDEASDLFQVVLALEPPGSSWAVGARAELDRMGR